MNKIILFYKYIAIEYPKQIMKWQREICQNLGLMGRILISHEGINGTLGGSVENLDENIDTFKDKQVLMYCTGGIRCERASAYLNEKNIAKKVYQMDGGIHRYVEQYPDGFFRGKNYVFDGRVSVRINDDVLGSCAICKTACDDYYNCLNAFCNKHF